jgi:Ser/Thr protein kinase RdoA (MazF antagonist)
MSPTTRRLRDILGQFDLGGDVDSITPCNVGHINDTFIASVRSAAGKRRYTLQRINGAVFPRPDLIMHNIGIITETIGRRAGDEAADGVLPALRLVPTRHGQSHHRGDDGEYWRCYRYVEGTTYNRVPDGRAGQLVAREAAGAFGRFAGNLDGLEAHRLFVTIEDFHNTPVRFLRLVEAAHADRLGRVRDAGREIDTGLAREDLCGAIMGPLDRGEIPLRIAHNDTKINNVVFDTGRLGSPKALCVIDLDTVMPGSTLFDFGDLVRSSVCRRPEDETDLDTVRVDLEIFRALVEGYCGRSEGRVPSLTGSERELLLTACLVITLETAMRFLTDHLAGDVYFRTERPGHNLDRARAQFRLLAEMEKKRDALEKIVKETVS